MQDDEESFPIREIPAEFKKTTGRAHKRDHDVLMMWSGDTPHPVAIKCEECDWTGVIHDGV